MISVPLSVGPRLTRTEIRRRFHLPLLSLLFLASPLAVLPRESLVNEGPTSVAPSSIERPDNPEKEIHPKGQKLLTDY